MSQSLPEQFEAVARKVTTYCKLIDPSVATKRGEPAFLMGMDPEHLIIGQVPHSILGRYEPRGNERSLYHVLVDAGLTLRDTDARSEAVILKDVKPGKLAALETELDKEIVKLQESPQYRKAARISPPEKSQMSRS